jgi:hypothetical protein
MTGHNRIPTKSSVMTRADIYVGVAIGIVVALMVIAIVCLGAE